jgi:hypothetical protein
MRMAECIEREAAIREIEQINPVDYGAMWDYEAHHWAGECLRDCKEAIDSIPAADVAPVVHGRWEMRPTGMATDTGPEYKAYCTICNEPNKQYRPPFCPHCGAKMDGGEE